MTWSDPVEDAQIYDKSFDSARQRQRAGFPFAMDFAPTTVLRPPHRTQVRTSRHEGRGIPSSTVAETRGRV